MYQTFTKLNYGSWLKDPLPKTDEIGEKIWMTNESDITHVYEYKNKERYGNNNYTKKHELHAPGFRVSSSELNYLDVIYQNSCYIRTADCCRFLLS